MITMTMAKHFSSIYKCVRCCSKYFTNMNSFNLHNKSRRRYYYILNFTDTKVEIWRR